MRTHFYILFFCLLSTAILAQPCGGLTVDAGADQSVCGPVGTATLNGIVTGSPIISTEWTPTTGLTNASSPNTSATVSANTTYTLTVKSFDPATNLIVNGDFESGNTGFTSDYNFAAMNLIPPGTYTVITSPSIVWATFPTCDDHTFMNGTGNMLAAHGASTPGNEVWCQTVNVTPNTDYAFSSWILTLFSLTPASLQFSINGTLLGNSFTTTNTICDWSQFYEVWNSGANTTADICIVDMGSGLFNGYAIDDIAFTPICEVTDEVTVEVVNLIAPPLAPQFLPCNAAGGTGMVIDASSVSSGPNITYSWTTSNGNIVSGGTTNMPTVNQIGTYNMTVTFNDGMTTCTANTSVELLPDPNVPIVFINPSGSITCNTPTLSLMGVGSAGPEYTYLWTTNDGNIVSGSTSLSPTINSGGTYMLVVTNTTNGCTADASITITEDTTPPTAVTAVPLSIDCNNISIPLDGTGSSIGANFTYLWTTNDGNIVSGATTLAPIINSGGTYQLTVTNTANGCLSNAWVIVGEDTTPPDAVANGTGNITCTNNQINLDGTGSSIGGSINYLWTTLDGNITNGATTLMPTIDVPGTYTIEVTNNANGCTNTADVTITGDITPPLVNILPPNAINCNNNTITLDGSNSSNGVGFSFIWTTVGGNISNNSNSLMPDVDAPGVYTLTITNDANGCTEETSVTVTTDTTPPVADAGAPTTIGCNNPLTQLDGSGSTQGVPYTYLWTTVDGNITNGASTLNPDVDAAGTYTLVVTNNVNGCTASDEVVIMQDLDVPVADPGTAPELTCVNPIFSLDGNNSNQGNNFQYLWTTNDGNIFSGATTLTPTINAAGTYTLTVTNINNNCTASANITVIGNITTPIADAGTGSELTCVITNINLDGSNSSTMGSYSYLWTTMDGNIVSGDTSLTPEINAAGTYNILVTNNDNGCISNADVIITEDTAPPIADAGQNLNLNCDTPNGALNGNNSSQGANFTYLWTTTDGNISNGDSTLMPQVDAGGTYNLLVTNTLNGCIADSNVDVILSGDLPIVDAAANGDLTCTNGTAIIDASNSSSGANFTFNWTTQNGNFANGQNTLLPEVDAPGIYTLTILDNSNSCEASLSIEIQQDTIAPIAVAMPLDTINCYESMASLDGNGSSSGSEFEYTWTTLSGNISGNVNDLVSIADAGGIYTLNVLNTQNGCESTAEVNIVEEMDVPIAEAGPAQTLTCSVTALTLGGNSSQGNEFLYEWTSAAGNFTSPTDSNFVEIDAAGDYEILVTNILNGCTANATINIDENTAIPSINAGIPAELNCTNTTLSLNGSGSTGNEVTYLWTTQDGNILMDETTLNPTIDAAGTYQLLITNITNDCADSASVSITENITLPVADAGQDFELSCAMPTGSLDGSNSDVGMNYLWTTQDGNITNDDMTLSPSIDAGGTYTLTVTNPQNGCTASDEVIITSNADTPTVVIENTDMLTCLNMTVILNAENSSQGNEFLYNWDTQDGNITSGNATLQPTVDAPGTYTLTITNQNNNCESDASIIVEADMQAPTANAGMDDFWNCNTNGVTLDGSASSQGNEYTYLWTTTTGMLDGDINSLNPNALAPGIYNLLVTNTQNGCEAQDEVIITDNIVLPMAIANAAQEITCINNPLTLDGTGSSVGNDFSYFWTTINGNIVADETTLMPLVNQAGIYELVVTNNLNQCTNSAVVEVFENTTPPTINIATPEMLDCVNSFTILDASASSQGNEFSYLWTTIDGNIQSGSGTLIPSVNAAGTYTLEITNSTNGCVVTESVEVFSDTELPMINIAPAEQLTCIVEELFLDASNSVSGFDYQIQWTTIDGNILQGDDSLTPLVNATGTYTLTILNTQNNCENTADVIVNEDLTPPIADAGESDFLPCDGSGMPLAGDTPNNEPLTITWTTNDGNIVSGANTLSPIIDAPGTYTLEIIKDGNGCSATDMVTISQDNLTSVETALVSPDCLGNEGSFEVLNVEGGIAPYLYSVDNGANFQLEPLFENLPSGNYQLVVQDVNGCEWEEGFQIADLPELVVSLSPSAELQLGESHHINTQINILPAQIADIQWLPVEGLSCTNCLEPIATPFQTTTYTVLVTDENGCSATASIEILVNGGLSIYVPNAFSPNDDGFNDNFMIFTAQSLNANIRTFQIFDRWGEQVFIIQNVPPNDEKFGWNGIFNGKKLNQGVYVYFAELEFPDGSTEIVKGDVLLMR